MFSRTLLSVRPFCIGSVIESTHRSVFSKAIYLSQMQASSGSAKREPGSAAKSLQFPIGDREGYLRHAEGTGSGPEGRMLYLRRSVNALFRHERVEMPLVMGTEVRKYAERLIQEAILRGDQDVTMMELADFWLTDKDLIHKLFKVFVPRYFDYNRAFTTLHKLPRAKHPDALSIYSEGMSVLELHGNPWPPVQTVQPLDKSRFLINVLITAAKKDWYKQRAAAAKDNENNNIQNDQNLHSS